MKKIVIFFFLLSYLSFSCQSEQNDNKILVPFRDGKLWGYALSAQNIVIQPQFEETFFFQDGLAKVKKNGKYGFIDIKGNSIIAIDLDWAWEFENDIALVKKNNLWGYINKKGIFIIPNQYYKLEKFTDGLAIAQKTIEGKYGVIDKDNKVIVPFTYDEIYPFKNGIAKVGIEQKYGYINTKGQIVVPLIQNAAINYTENLAKIRKNGEYGYIDTTGKMVIQPQFTDAEEFESVGLARVKKEGKWGIIDTKGNFIIQPKYEFIYPLKGKIGRIIHRKKYGFIDITNRKEIIAPEYESAEDFSADLALVKKDKNIYFINTQNQIAFHLTFDHAEPFYEGVAVVRKGSQYGFVEEHGKLITELKYKLVRHFENGFGKVQIQNGEWGFIDKKGNEYFRN